MRVGVHGQPDLAMAEGLHHCPRRRPDRQQKDARA
jgi:hypothetical protein